MESKHYKWFLMALLLGLLIVLPMALGQSTTEAGLVGVKAGDWVKYKVIRIGPESAAWHVPMDKAMWIKTEVLNVSGTNVTLLETIHLIDGSDSVRTHSWDLQKTPSSGFCRYVVASNLSPGDKVGDYTVWLNETGTFKDVELKLNATVSRTYGGVEREVNMLEWSHFGPYDVYIYSFYHEFCWDKSTGFLLEKTFQTYVLSYGNASMSTLKLEIADTNMWKMEAQPFWNQAWPWAIVGLVGTTATGGAIIVKLPKSRDKAKVHER